MELDNHDLATLPNLNEEIILEYLKIRYENDIIYTYIGDILLAINPFKQLPIYDQKHHRLYTNSNRKIAPPHVYALADFAYEALKSNSYSSQCCVISGESGAGKTESTKHFIKHLIHLCLGNTRLELQILQVNPLLEAFGNAKTLMNDNSSRFGKYIELMFVNNKVVGGKISEYLLEKSRVVFQNGGEQNFHIFYYLLAGLEDQNDRYYLKNESNNEYVKFNYLNGSINNDLNYKRELIDKYDELINAMNYVAFMESEQMELFSALIGILHVGNLKFKSNDEGYAIFVNSKDAKLTLLAISNLLGINTCSLIEALTTSLPTAGGRDEFMRNYTLEAALDARDALAKHVYSKLFSWIVHKINNTLLYENSNGSIKEIGILDIYGFEHFQKNGFEQLCINLANEQIQYFFNKHIFTLEKEEYSREGIHSIEITFNDNQPLLDLFMGTSGILKKLDDLCKLPRTTDASLIENFNKEFSKNAYYTPSKRNDINFTINHYAGRVMYTSENFLEKNRDSLPFRVSELLRNSSNEILSEIFSGQQSTSASKDNSIYSSYNMSTMRNLDKSLSRLSVSAQYRNSLEVLMKRMSESRPIFLRCIKPNSSKRPDDFNEKFVLLQLRYCGVLETTRIRKEGYSLRPTFQEFVERYKYLSPDNSISSDAYTCTKILKNSNLKNWRVGRTKVFLKYYHYEQLKLILDQYVYYATCIQKYVRRWLAKRELRKKLDKANKEQNKVAEFCGYLHLKSLNVFQTIQKSSQIKLPRAKSIEKDMTSNKAEYNKKNNLDRDVDQYSQSSDTSNGNKIYDNLNNRSTNGTTKSNSKILIDSKKRDPCWLYGKITRGQSEEYLKSKEVGTFLIRKSDSREGYSLSFKAENRCRHYMIDALPNGKFIIIGEPRVHNTLKDLVEYHRKHKLSNWNGYLSHPFMADNNISQ